MFKKVLVVEDFDSINLGIEKALKDIDITTFHHAKYCDDALLRIRKALLDNEPYDLLISDLSFKIDHRKVQIENGDELINHVRKLQPELKIIVYSIEDKSHRIKALFNNNNLNAFVSKGRNSIVELKKAITIITEHNKYISPEIATIIQEKNTYEIDDLDVLIIKHLSLGVPQDNIGSTFKEMGIKPSSKSTIEKRIAKLKDFFKANNTIHLVSISKDMGII